MKRLFALLLIFVMVCGMFAACGDVSDSTVPTGGANSNTVPTQPAEFKNTDKYPLKGDHVLTMGVSLDNADDAYLMEMMEEAVGVSLKYQMVTDEQAPLLFLDPESMPDMLFDAAAKFGLSMDQINEYGKSELLINYMDYLDQMPNLAKAYAEHPDLFDGVITLDGEVYTLPYYVFTLKGVNNLLYFREDHMNLVGWEQAPTTIDEFTKYLRDLKAYFGATDAEYIPLTVYSASNIGYNPHGLEHQENHELLLPLLRRTDGSRYPRGYLRREDRRWFCYRAVQALPVLSGGPDGRGLDG